MDGSVNSPSAPRSPAQDVQPKKIRPIPKLICGTNFGLRTNHLRGPKVAVGGVQLADNFLMMRTVVVAFPQIE